MGLETIGRCVGRRGLMGPFCGAVDFEKEWCGQIASVDGCANVKVLESRELKVCFRSYLAERSSDVCEQVADIAD